MFADYSDCQTSRVERPIVRKTVILINIWYDANFEPNFNMSYHSATSLDDSHGSG